LPSPQIDREKDCLSSISYEPNALADALTNSANTSKAKTQTIINVTYYNHKTKQNKKQLQ